MFFGFDIHHLLQEVGIANTTTSGRGHRCACCRVRGRGFNVIVKGEGRGLTGRLQDFLSDVGCAAFCFQHAPRSDIERVDHFL